MGKKVLDDFRDFEVCGQTWKSQKYKYFENETFFLQIKTWLTFYIKALWYGKKKFQSDITFTLWLFFYLISIVTQKTFLSFFKR